MNQPDLTKLKSTLITSGLQQSNPSLYQVIVQLINAIKQFQGITVSDINNINNEIIGIINNPTELPINTLFSTAIDVNPSILLGYGTWILYAIGEGNGFGQTIIFTEQ